MKESKRRLNLSKELLPLLIASNKKNDTNLLKLFDEVDSKVFYIIDQISDIDIIDKSLKLEIKNDLAALLSNLLSYNVIFDNNYILDESVDELIEYIQFSQDSLKKVDKKNKKEDIIIISTITSGLFSEINRFHSMLYFSNIITFQELQLLNNNITVSVIQNLGALIEYLKENNFNGKRNIYDIVKLSTRIYIDILEGLFLNLSKSEDKMIKYKENQEKYIEKIEKIYIEQYSIFNTSCSNLNKKLTIEK
jgi:hypothetical protein